MARPISLELPPRDARAELQSRLVSAPTAHAEALLAGYELLQGLHERGVFDLLRGVLGSSDNLIELAVETARSPESIRALRNLLSLFTMLGSIDPEKLKMLTGAIPSVVEAAGGRARPVGLGRLIADFFNKDFRRGMGAVNAALETLGKRLHGKTSD